MAETFGWCVTHGASSTRRLAGLCGEAEPADDVSCRIESQVRSVPGELVDPVNPADILAAVRTLPGVEEQRVALTDYWVLRVDNPGRYLIVPLSEEE